MSISHTILADKLQNIKDHIQNPSKMTQQFARNLAELVSKNPNVTPVSFASQSYISMNQLQRQAQAWQEKHCLGYYMHEIKLDADPIYIAQMLVSEDFSEKVSKYYRK